MPDKKKLKELSLDLDGEEVVTAHPKGISTLHELPVSALDGEELPEESNNPLPTTWTPSQATVDITNPQGISVGITGKPDVSFHSNPIHATKTAEDIKTNTVNASRYIAQDITDNLQNLPPEYEQNLKNVPFTSPGNIIHDITDPHGDPAMTAGYMNTRLTQLNRDHLSQQQAFQAKLANDPSVDLSQGSQIESDYFNKNHALKENASHLIDLQLANKAQQDKIFDPILLGIEKQKLLGNKKAEQDAIDYQNKRPLTPQAKFAYQAIGLSILQNGKENTAANGQNAISEQFGEHSDDSQKRLEKDNPEVFKNERIQQIANQIYKTENPVHGTIFSRESVSQEEMEDAAKQIGLTKKQIENIKPEDIPRSAGLINQAVQGFANTIGAPLYEGAMRGLAARGLANQEAVNARFTPGWEEESGFGHLFTGNTPQAQHELSVDNVRGVIGAMAKGIGDLGGFLITGEAGANLLKGTGLIPDAIKANKVSNFATAALPSYNAAYEKSIQVIGDDPNKEAERQLYSISNGVIGGALMMIDPKADIGRDIIGDTKGGTDFIKMLKKGGLSDLTKEDLTNKYAQIIQETGKHLGLQIAIPVAQTAAENLSDMVFDPKGNHDITDNTRQAAISGAIGMFIPSLLAGMHTPQNQTAMNKSMMWEVGSNSRPYREEVVNAYKNGELSKDDALTAINSINKFTSIIKNDVPVESLLSGKKLSPEQQQNYAWNLLRSNDLNNKLDRLNSGANPDKSQVKIVNDELTKLTSERTDILNKAGEIIPKERPTPAAENNSKKTSDESKEDLSLTPDLNSTSNEQKTSNEQDNGQSGSKESETQDIGTDSELRQAAGMEGVSGKENRQVEAPSGTNNKEGGAEMQPPISVSGKERRKRKPLVVDEEPIPVVEEPKLQTQDLGKAKGQSEVKTEDQVKEATIAHPDKPADILVADKPQGESFNEAKDRFKAALDEIAKDAPDNSVVVTHSWGLKLIDAAEKTGWDHPELAEAHQKGTTEPGDLIPYKMEDGRTIWFARHGESEDNTNDLQRTDNTPLTEKGREQAKEIADKLKEKGIAPSQIITSDLLRAKETSGIISKEFKKSTQTSNAEPTDVLVNSDGEFTPKAKEIADNKLKSASLDEINTISDNVINRQKKVLTDALGDEGYKKYQSLENIVNSSNSGRDEALRAEDELSKIDASLTEEQKKNLSLSPEEYYDPTEYKKIQRIANTWMRDDIHDANEETLLNAIGREATLGDIISNVEDHIVFREAYRELKRRGYSDNDIFTKALNERESRGDNREHLMQLLKNKSKQFKPNENASTQSEAQQQESIQQGSEPEHARTEQVRIQITTTEAKSGNSSERSPRRQKKKITDFQQRKKNATKDEPQSFEEKVLHFILGGSRVQKDGGTGFDTYIGHKGKDASPYLRRLSNKSDALRVEDFVSNEHDQIEAAQKFWDIFREYGHDDTKALEELERIKGIGENSQEEYDARREEQLKNSYKPTLTEAEIDAFMNDGEEMNNHQIIHDAIENLEMTNDEAQSIINYINSIKDENGDVDINKMDPFSDEFQQVFHNLTSEDAKNIFDVITGADSEKSKSAIKELSLQYEGQGKSTTEERQPAAASQEAIAGGGVENVSTEGTSEKENPSQEVKFKTAKGSEYTLHTDGTTTRNKAAREDVGHEGEQGIQPRSEKTYFITKEDLGKLDKVQTSGWPEGEKPTIADLGNGKIAVGITGGERHGKYLPETKVEYSTEPKTGLYPLEVLKGGTIHHFGNEITSVENIGKPQETPQPNGAIANEVTEQQRAQPPKEKTSEERLSEIEEDLKKQRASQKLEGEKRTKAKKEKDIPAANKANDNWHKKKEKIDKLEEEKESIQKKMDREEREEYIKKVYNDFADKLEKKYEANRAQHKGAALSNIIGLSTKIGDHVADFVVARAIEGIRELSNIHIAIDRAIRLAKEKFGAEADDLSKKDINTIRTHLIDQLGQKEPKIDKEPVLPIDQEEYAKDIVADIKNGHITAEEGFQEVIDEQILNRQGQPVSDHVSENNKAKIQNYIKWHVDQDVTSIRNETTRLRREQFGLNEEIPAAKKEFGKTWDEAKQKIEDNPQKIPELIHELSQKARPLTDVENAILLHHQNTKEIELLGLNDKINKSAEEGNASDILEYKTSKARVLDELQQIYDINKAVGTENARGLASRRMMVDRKYSLVNMLSEKRATANEGKPLSEQQQQEVEALHQKIKETQDAFDDYIKKSESQIIDLQRKALNGKLKDKKTASTKLREWAERIRNASKNQAYSSPIPITPHMVADAIDLIAYGVEKGEQLIDLVKKAVAATSKGNPGIDEEQLEREINKSLIDSGILEVSPERRSATDMSGLFANGKLDREAIRLKTDADRAKAQYEINLKKDKEAERSNLAKAQNLFVKWERAFKLSNPLTMGKLAMAGLTRLATTPLEDIVGGAYSAILPQLAKGSIGEGGGLNISETARTYKTGLMQGIKDSKQIMSKESQGKSELDVLFGKAGELPPEAIDFFGQLHSATKAPIKRIMFERSLERRLRRNLANGVDITDPMVQTSVMVGAYKDANRAIFMQDNKVADGWQKLIKHFSQIDPKTNEPRMQGLATAMQVLVPFVKVPSNIVAETGKHIYGVPVAAYKLLHASFTKGIENLSEDQKDIILRNLKKGSLGVAAMALGYYNAQNFGGYYQPGQKRDEKDAEALGFKFFGQKVPSWVGEAPIFQAMQFGATVKRVSNHYISGEKEGFPEGVITGLLDVVQANPLANQPLRIGALFKSSKERQYYLGELAKSTVDPAIITYLAKVTDPADKGNPIRKALAPENKRKTPKTIMEHIKSGLPFLREQLLTKDDWSQ